VIDLLVATTNAGKLAEVRAFLQNLPLNIVSLEDLLTWPKVIEDGRSFEENALKKARTLCEYSGYYTLADDSGLEVDALNGAPGIYSARYGGAEGDDNKNNQKLLEQMKSVPQENRGARFVCALALCAPHGDGEWITRAVCEGTIAFECRGENGFGYDPLFFYPPLGTTFGEIDRETKAQVSHRGKALKKLADALPGYLSATAKP
jgi:XTP/dITP diphosphohydrolase